MGNDEKGGTGGGVTGDFNPRSRVGNDTSEGDRKDFKYISIHVPAWGTTYIANDTTQINFISIHVPAWGTTHILGVQ